MKMGKKTTALLAFSIGAMVFATSAMADVAIGSGYNNLKNAAKETMAKLTKDVDNFQADMKMNVKLDGTEFLNETATSKFDMKGKRSESQSTFLQPDGKTRKSYSYGDAQMNVYKSEESEKYQVYQYEEDRDYTLINNPFEEEMAADAEKVVDAFVGSLKDVVQMEETDNKKMYIANLTETQIPTFVNALTSFVAKYSLVEDYRMEEMNLPKITNDLCVRNVSGKAIENEMGILEDILGTITLAGTDDNGADHELTAEFSVSISGINETDVVKPELTDENAEYTTNSSGSTLGAKYVGVYKNDIVESDSSSFRKVGERVLEITQADENGFSGQYYEVYSDGYTPENTVAPFTFTSAPDVGKGFGDSCFVYTDASGNQAYGILDKNGASEQNLYLTLGVQFNEDGDGYSYSDQVMNFNREFIRMFE